MKFNILSAILGAAVILGFSAQMPSTQGHHTAQPATANLLVQIAGVPAPHQIVTIHESAPLTVPAGKILIVQAIGASTSYQDAELLVDGVRRALTAPGDGTSNLRALPAPGLRVDAGSVVVAKAFSAEGNGVAIGYLGDV